MDSGDERARRWEADDVLRAERRRLLPPAHRLARGRARGEVPALLAGARRGRSRLGARDTPGPRRPHGRHALPQALPDRRARRRSPARVTLATHPFRLAHRQRARPPRHTVKGLSARLTGGVAPVYFIPPLRGFSNWLSALFSVDKPHGDELFSHREKFFDGPRGRDRPYSPAAPDSMKIRQLLRALSISALTLVLFAAARAQSLPSKCVPPVVAAPAASGPNIFTEEQEAFLGDAMAEQIQKDYRLVEDEEVTGFLTRIGQ